MTARLAVASLSKTFGPARVLKDVGLEIAPGELHGLVGQNGCGKSTLVKILSGVYTPDPGGSVQVDGQALPLPVRPLDARAAGVSVVHQNLGIVGDFTVWENVRLGHYRRSPALRRIDRGAERRAAAAVLDRLGRRIDVDARTGDLSAEDRATVAIARAVQDHRPGSGLVIFDESTRALTRDARARFYELVRTLLSDGAAVLLISHQLEEIIEVTDRVTVLRDGAVVETGVRTSDTDEAGLTRMMLGRHVVAQRAAESRAQPTTAATVRGLSVGSADGIDLQVQRGEIVGLTGLVGSGFEEIAAAIGGATRARAGELVVGDTVLQLGRRRTSTRDHIAAGIGFVGEKRLEEGVSAEMTVQQNITLPRLTDRGRPWRMGEAWQVDEAERMIARLGIRPPDRNALISNLSGGNQQKVLLGKWLAGDPRLLVLHEPTQAVDVGARQDIVEAIRDAAAGGCGVLVASVDAADLAVLCDRVLVVRSGHIAAELSGDIDADGVIEATFGATDRKAS